MPNDAEKTPELKIIDHLKEIAEGQAKTAETLKAYDSRFDGIEKEAKEFRAMLDEKATQDKALAEQKRAIAAIRNGFESRGAVYLPDLEEQENKAGRKFSLARACQAIDRNNWNKAGLEKETFQETEKKAQALDPDSAGGYLVPAQVEEEVIGLLDNMAVFRAMGAFVMSGLRSSPLRIPRINSGATGYWVGESTAITDSSMAFEQISLMPRKSAALVILSNELVSDGGPGVEALVRQDIATRLALLQDLAFFRGSGSSNQPLGMANTSGINTVTLNATPSLNWLIDMIAELMTDNNFGGRLGWAMHSRTWKDLWKLQDTDGRNLIQPDLQAVSNTGGSPWTGRLWGIPYWITNQLPITLGGTSDESEMYLMRTDDIIIGEWGGLNLLRSEHYRFAEDDIAIRATQRVDIITRHPESVVLTNDVRTA